MNKLTQEELLEELSRSSAGTYGRRKQMHNQLREIVEAWFVILEAWGGEFDSAVDEASYIKAFLKQHIRNIIKEE